eukprot:gene900-1125_t
MEESNGSYNSDENDIAIIGFGIRFPHEANDLNQFWDMLINKIDGITELDEERCSHSFYHNDEMDSNKLGQVNDWKNFDPLFFGLAPKDAPCIDPQGRLLLKVTWETMENSQWNKTCVGKVSVFPHSKNHAQEKEDIDFLLKKYQYFTSVNCDEVYQTIKMNTKVTYGPHFRVLSDVKLSKDFILTRIDLQKQTSIFDSNSFFNPPLLDFHSPFITQQFPNGVVFHSIKDFKYYTSNIPKNRNDHRYMFLKASYLKSKNGITYFSSIKVFLEDGTILIDCPWVNAISLKKIDDSNAIKYPSKSIYSSFHQSKESDVNYEFIKINQIQNPSSNIHMSEPFLPYVMKLLFKSVQERAPFIRKEILSNLSLGELETKYFKTETKWVYLFRTVIKSLKENLELIKDDESDLELMMNQTKSNYPGLFEVFYFEKSIPMINGILFGEPGEVVAQTLVSDGTLSRLYNSPQFNDILKLFSSSLEESLKPLIKSKEKRIIRILELGSGTGALSKTVLEGLERIIRKENEESNIEIEYTFTDISTSFFVEAKQLFNKFNSRNINIVYKLVDISKDFQSQGLNNGYYDFIVMFLVLHVTTHIEPSLQYIYKSLKPGGNLIFVELNKKSILQDLLIGVMDQWWGFQDHELRPDHCCLNSDTWEIVLKKTGFQNNMLLSTNSDFNIDTIMNPILIFSQKPTINQLSQTIFNTPPSLIYNQCFIITNTKNNNIISQKLQEFYNNISQSMRIIKNTNEFKEISSTIGPNDIIIFSKGIEPLTIDNFTEVDMEYTFINQFLLSNNLPTKHLLITTHSQSENYLNSSLVGIFRSFTEFNQLQLYSIDIDSLENNNISKIEYICNQDHFPEREFIIRNNQVIIENWTREPNNNTKSKSYETEKLAYNLDNNLEPKLKPFDNNLQTNQVLIRVKSIGLNFRDTLYHRGVLKSNSFFEFSGEIIKVHGSVNKFKVGDSVIGIKFEMKNVKDAYNLMIERKNIGKIVITDFDDSVLQTTIHNQIQQKNFIKKEYSIDPAHIGSTILITGQSGTAFEVIKWIINHSIDSIDIIVLSQSKIKFELEFIQNKLIHQGSKSRIHFRQVDISKIDEIRNSINDIYQSKSNIGRAINPIESIIHFAFSLHDSPPEDITLEKYNIGHSAKTLGALNLHQLSLELNLNLKNFILCSSVATTLGSQFQCVYMSSNCVINSLSNYRRSIGLPSTSVILGLLPVGGFHSSEVITSKFDLLGYKKFSIPKMLGIFDFVIQNNQENFLFIDMNQIKGFKPLLLGWDYIKNKYYNGAIDDRCTSITNGDETSIEYRVVNTFASYLFISNNNNYIEENDIAIIGFGIRFPHGVNDLNQFWYILINKIDGVTEIDEERCNHSFYHNGEVESNKFGQVDDWRNFDPLFFGIPPKDAPQLDPQTRLLNQKNQTFDVRWNKTCVGKVSIFPHSQKLVQEKEDMDFLLNKCQYFTSVKRDEVYQTIKMNTKITYGPHFRNVLESNLSQDFILSKIDLGNETSIFDSNSFFNPPLLDFHIILLPHFFSNGCVFHSIKDLKYFTSNIPKNRKDHKYLFLKTDFLKSEDGTLFFSKFKVFLEDGTVLMQCAKGVVASLKRVNSSTVIKYPSNSIYSPIYQPKDSDLNYDKFIKNNQILNTISNSVLEIKYLPYVMKLLFKSIQERAPFIRKVIISNSSLDELETKYFKSEIKWVYLFRTVFKLLKDNLDLIQDDESDLESVINQTRSIDPVLFEVFYFEKSVPMISGILFGEPGEVLGQTIVSNMSKIYQTDQMKEYLTIISSTICESLKPLIKSKEKRIIRILELGSGTGTQTNIILEGLERIIQQENEESKIEIEYTFTDISTSFFVEAKQKFNIFNSRNINIVYKLVDISKDFQSQGLNNGYYDFIVMFLVLHVTTHIEPSLQYIYKSLKPGGNLLFIELTKKSLLQDLLTGVLDQWWGFQDHELRPDHCSLNPDTWEMVLKKTGFQNNILLSKNRIEPLTIDNFTEVDMEYTFINQFLLSNNLPTKHILLTRNSQSENYLNSSLVGIFRSFTEYNELQLFSIDIDSLDNNNNNVNDNIISKIEYICNQDHFPEREFIIRNNQIIIENWTRELNNNTKSISYETLNLGYNIDINLELQLKPFNSNLHDNQVLIRVKSIGLNFRDTLYHRGIVKSFTGIEFSGEIIQIHESVNKFKVGDCKIIVKQLQDIVGAISREGLQVIPIKEFEMKNVKDAYNLMIERKNIGKIVITDFDDSVLQTTIHNQIQQKNFIKKEYSIDPAHIGSTILITGQSGTAFEVIKWIINHSIDSIDIIVLSQSKIKFRLEFIQKELIHDGSKSRIHFRQVDISKIDEIRNSINDIYQLNSNTVRTINPIESIFHFAFSLHDSPPEDITLEKYNIGHSAKTIGALNLHQLSLELKLNLKNFILCSSITAILGSKYQCVYMSSNSVIHSLSNYRRSIGLPSTTLILGLLPVGEFHSSDVMDSKFDMLGYKKFSIPKMLGIFDFAIQNNQQDFIFISLNHLTGFKPLLLGWDYVKNKYYNSIQDGNSTSISNGDETSIEYRVTNTFASYLCIHNTLICGLISSSFAEISVSVDQDLELNNVGSARDFGNFAVGFLEGIEYSLSGNVKRCVSTAETSFGEFSKSFSLIDSGFKHKSLSDSRAGIRDFGIGLIDLVKTYERCGVGKLISEISAISKEVTNETGIIRLVINEVLDILHNYHSLSNDFKSAISSCGRSDFTGCGAASGRIVGILLHQ